MSMIVQSLATLYGLSQTLPPQLHTLLGSLSAGVPSQSATLLFDGTHQPQSHLVHLILSFGLIGFFLVSVVDSSFVPLPIPGVSDLMIIFFAAQGTNLILLLTIATAGSALGGYLSFRVGQKGGMQFLESHVPERIFKRICGWMEGHALLSVALPAILPPPMPLSPFVLAAGALRMSMQRFMASFTISRFIRHVIAAWAGVHYGKQVLGLWAKFSDKWATTILIAFWAILLVGVGIAFWRLYRTSKSIGGGAGRPPAMSPSAG